MSLIKSTVISLGFERYDYGDRRCYTRQYGDHECLTIYEANKLFYFQHEGGITYIDDETHLRKIFNALSGKEL